MKHIVCLLMGLIVSLARADDSVVKFLVGFAPGGGQYIVTKIISDAASRQGYKNIVLHKEGVGGIVGMNECVENAKQNYLCMATEAQYVHSIILPDSVRKYNVEDLEYLMVVAESPNVLITNNKNRRSLPAVINHVKTQPVSFANGALGLTVTTDFIVKSLHAKDAVQAQYKGTGPALIDVISGVVDYAVVPYTVVKNRQDVRIVANLGFRDIAGIPKLHDYVPGLADDTTHFGFVMSPNADKNVVDRYKRILNDATTSSTVKEQFADLGVFQVSLNSRQFKQHASDSRHRLKTSILNK